jgi:predicted metal-dependent phosphoesterase TrpH
MRRHIYIYLYLFIAIAIIAAAVCFHHPVRLVNVLTDNQAGLFQIKISPWRVILEPFIGPLIFYLHANQPLKEFAVLLPWILAALLVITLYKNRQKPFSGFVNWLASIPLVLLIWIGIGFIGLFVQLPNDKVISQDPQWILVNFHSHSYYSHDGLLSPAELSTWHRSHGFDAFFLTEHNNHQKTLELQELQRQGTFPLSPLVLCGHEYSGSNHLLLLGLSENFNSKDMPDSAAIQKAHEQKGAAFVAHWFRKKTRSIQYYIDCGADGFEIVNQNEGLYYDRQVFRNIMDACSSAGLLMIGACDYHGYGNVCSVWNALQIPGWHQMDIQQKRDSILQLLRHRDQSKLVVMVYTDRPLGLGLAWSPFYNIFYYFRSLNLYQAAAWIVWLFLYYKIFTSRIFKKIRSSISIPACAGILTGLWMIFWGIDFFMHSAYLKEYNEIFHHSAPWLIVVGITGAIYSRYRLSAKKKINF